MNRRTQHPDASATGRRGGFSLAEVLTVIAVIALLVAILVPSVLKFRTLAQRSTVRGNIAMLEMACGLYKDDFGQYPPSKASDASSANAYSGWQGSELLCLLLTGYGPDANNDNKPLDGTNSLAVDDGVEGFGYRTQLRVARGPYNDTHKLNMRTDGRPVFVDLWGDEGGQAILYYRFDDKNTKYQKDDNSQGPPANMKSGEEKDIDDYARRSTDPADEPNDVLRGKHYRQDFIIISRGPDGRWQVPSAPGGDDVTNMQE